MAKNLTQAQIYSQQFDKYENPARRQCRACRKMMHTYDRTCPHCGTARPGVVLVP